MGKGGGKQTIGYRYYMSLQYGICRGPIDEIVQIKAGDKSVWPNREGEGNYDSTITGDRTTSIQAPDIFGGEKAEGGIQGTLTALMGSVSQVYPAWFKGLLGGDVPDFRGVATVIFDGMICALNPYPKEWKFRLRRTNAGWDGDVWQPSLSTIWLADGRIRAMNPAHILYECITNRQWGRGYDRSRIGETTWVQVASTLYNEGFGLCMKWSRQDSLQAFIQEILDHIGGTLFVNRETGLLDLDLIRDNYNVEDLPLFDRTSGLLSVVQSEAATQADAISEIIVKYKDVLLNEEQEVRAQNLAVIQSNEGTSSKTNNYNGIPTLSLAARVAQRDLRSTSASTNRYTVKLDRRAWRIRPGSVFRVSDPDMGIENLVLRAGKVNDGTLTNGPIQVEAALDVFGLSSTAFISPEEPAWQPPNSVPLVITDRVVREMTYQELVGRISPADLAILDVNATALATAAFRPSQSLLNYSISTRTGGDPFVIRGSEAFAPGALCNGAIGHYDSLISFDHAVDTGLMEVGTLIQVDSEIMSITAITLNSDEVSGSFNVLRGCVDTVPASHPDNAKIIFLSDNVGTDSREYVTSDVIDVKLLSNTSSATLNEALAPTDSLTMIGRQGRPYAPGAVTVNSAPCFNPVSVGANFRIDWTHRDRKLQADQIVSHWDANVGPEAGTTYTLRFYSSSNALIRTISGVTANFRTFTSADNTLTGSMFVEIEAVRDGISSLQKYRFPITRSI
ncbi:phage tail protein [Rhizobium nepotum]|uniref:phage tail protein n=1 Tax=Rhizobium nepotum TaxID=1035271 RepID=UPI003CF842E6